MTTNRKLAAFIKDLMPAGRGSSTPDRPISVWKELDRIRGFSEDTVVSIFRTKGCSWYNYSSCSMCGYFNDIDKNVTVSDLKKQIDYVADSIRGINVLKVFTSGSFLDTQEIPLEVRNYFLEAIGGKVKALLVESRTEYITESNLSGLNDHGFDVRIAIGLETSNDNIMKNSINKGSTYSKYVKAAELSRAMGFSVRTYLLFKPLFTGELSAIDDMLHSISDVDALSDDISVNPMNIQKNTLVEYFWKRNMYRPPRLWSLAKVLLDSRKEGRTVISYPTGGDRERGVHNDSSDRKLLDLIVKSSLTQDFSELESYYQEADLTAFWKELRLEELSLSTMDLSAISKRSLGYGIPI